MSYQPTPPGRDPKLWQLANRRASFKKHLATYLIINVFLWLIWAFTGSNVDGNRIPWPAWTTLGWGVGLFFHYIGAYVSTGTNAVDKEYEKLQNQNK